MSGAGYECTDRAGDAAAYALGALARNEAEAFLRHTRSCVVCRDEILEYGVLAQALALSPPQYRTPRRLKRAVMKQVTAPGQRAQGRRHTRAFFEPRAQQPSAHGWRAGPRHAGALAAVAVAAGGALALGWTGAFGTGGHANAVHTFAAQVHGVSASAEVRLDGTHAELVVHHLPQPAAGHIYEVWTARPKGTPQPTSALFSVTSSGAGIVEIPGDARSIAKVMVTQEPAGGSRRPTSTPVIVASLT